MRGSLATALALLLAANCGMANEQRRATEAKLEGIQKEIAKLQAALESDRSLQQAGQQALRELDLALQQAALRSRELKQQSEQLERNIQQLRDRQKLELEQLKRRESELGEQLLMAWKLMRESRLKLILNQDEPARVNRLLAYYDHFNQAQNQQISQLRSSLADLEALSHTLDTELAELAAVEGQQRSEQQTLDRRRLQQAGLLDELQKELSANEAQLAELRRNRQDLETLLEKLDDVLADIPSDIGDRSHPRALKGQLPMPVQGPVAKAFGQARAAGLRWQGWMIGASSGTEIGAVAYGRVAYADWLRGYGLLLIIDHGEGFMSLYGHNESLLAEVGDWVQADQPVATVGQQGNQASGLYFEIRSNGDALDPAVWIKRR